jgi:hypothetical protein
VINLIAKNSIEERIYAGIQLKTDLFQGVFDGTTDMVEFSREKRTELLNQLREMMQEEPEPVPAEPVPAEEIADDTPHFLNPAVLESRETFIARDFEENIESSGAQDGEQEEGRAAAAVFADQPPEKMEQVLNTGMAFIGGLLEMATGKKIETSGADEKMIHIDKDTGEVTMKFKLPGF